MESPLAAVRSIVPSMSLVCSVVGAEANAASIRGLASVAKKLAVPTTWIVDQPRQAKMLAGIGPHVEVAANVTARSPQRLRSELSNLQVGVESLSGQAVSVVAGDPQQLRARASLLDDLGIGAIIANPRTCDSSKPPRQLPCGLWQLDPSIVLPRPRRRWSFLPTRTPSVSRLIEGARNDSALVAIDLAEATTRDVQVFSKIMEEAAQATRTQKLTVIDVHRFAKQLSDQHEVKPQRSILRRAA